jgi:hypothetical protein
MGDDKATAPTRQARPAQASQPAAASQTTPVISDRKTEYFTKEIGRPTVTGDHAQPQMFPEYSPRDRDHSVTVF